MKGPHRRSGPPAFRSLRRKMAFSHGLMLAVIVLLLGGGAYRVLATTLDRNATATVRDAAQSQADRIGEAGRAQPPLDNDRPSAAAIRVAVFTPDGRVLGEGTDVPPWVRPHGSPVVTVTALGERVRLATVPVVVGGSRLATVVAAQPLAPQDRLLARLRLLFVIGGIAAAAISVAAGWLLADRAARPVRRAYEAQAGFAADASHELRTPLAYVRMGVEAMAERDATLGSEVLREVDYLASLTDRLLALARTDSGLVPGSTPIDVAEACRRAVKRSEVTGGISGDVHAVGRCIGLGDAVSLEAAIDALLENVARHGGGQATVMCRHEANRVRVDISDRGPGIPATHRKRVFERFYRVDEARTHENGSAGLGLSLARSLVEAQAGRMWLEETPGGGLTVRIDLAAAPTSLAAPVAEEGLPR